MNLIYEIKSRVDIVDVAIAYGLPLNRKLKCCCPFHKEKTPSFSISRERQIFKCFGCNAGGDVIELVSKLLNINSREAAISINERMGLGVVETKTTKREINHYEIEKMRNDTFNSFDNQIFRGLINYRHYLLSMEEKCYKTKSDKELSHIYHELMLVDYFLDFFTTGTTEEKKEMYSKERKYLENVRRSWI